jgi:hypothetical protein
VAEISHFRDFLNVQLRLQISFAIELGSLNVPLLWVALVILHFQNNTVGRHLFVVLDFDDITHLDFLLHTNLFCSVRLNHPDSLLVDFLV